MDPQLKCRSSLGGRQGGSSRPHPCCWHCLTQRYKDVDYPWASEIVQLILSYNEVGSKIVSNWLIVTIQTWKKKEWQSVSDLRQFSSRVPDGASKVLLKLQSIPSPMIQHLLTWISSPWSSELLSRSKGSLSKRRKIEKQGNSFLNN